MRFTKIDFASRTESDGPHTIPKSLTSWSRAFDRITPEAWLGGCRRARRRPPIADTRRLTLDRPNRRATHRSAINEQRKYFHQHRPASKSPSSCSAANLKSRPKVCKAIHVSPNARPQHFCLPAANVAEHCIVKVFTMRLQIG